MRSPSHRFRRIFRAKSEAKAKSENRPRCRAKSESRPRWKNPDLGAAQARQAGGSDAGQVRRNFRQWSTGQLEKFFAEVVGLDDNLDIFFAGKNSPWRGLGRAPMPGRWRGRASMPGAAGTKPNPHSPRALLYVLYVLYLTRHSPRVPCYMCYMCYMALYSTYSTDFARTEYIAHIVHIARTRGRVGVRRLGAASMPGRWRGRGGFFAGQVARQGGAPGVPRTCSSDMYSDMLKQLSV